MGYSRKRKGSDEGDDDVVATKRSKGSDDLPSKLKDADGNSYWEAWEHVARKLCTRINASQISGKRRLQISEFKGMTMVNIREYYEKDGKSLPGKAGINLPLEQFRTFLSLLPQVIDELKSKGETVEVPSFDSNGHKRTTDEDDDEEEKERKTKPKKANIEATSDEEEDD